MEAEIFTKRNGESIHLKWNKVHVYKKVYHL